MAAGGSIVADFRALLRAIRSFGIGEAAGWLKYYLATGEMIDAETVHKQLEAPAHG